MEPSIRNIGKIKSFSYKINDQGGFDCTTELTSMGSTLFKGQIEPAPEEAVNEVKESLEDLTAINEAAVEAEVDSGAITIQEDAE